MRFMDHLKKNKHLLTEEQNQVSPTITPMTLNDPTVTPIITAWVHESHTSSHGGDIARGVSLKAGQDTPDLSMTNKKTFTNN